MKRFLAGLLAFLLLVGPASAGPLPLLGAGKPNAGGGGGATFIRSASMGFPTAGSLTVDFGAGTTAGQLLVCYFINNGASLTATLTASSTAMTVANTQSDASSTNNYLLYAILGASDPATHTISIANAANDYGGECAVYSGATVATYKDFIYTPYPGTTASFTGFSPSGSTKGVVVMGAQGGNPAAGSSLAATSFTQRSTGTIMTPGSPYWEASGILDWLSGYGGGAVNVSGYTAAVTNPTTYLFELT